MCAQKIEDEGTITRSPMDDSYACMETRFPVGIFSYPDLLTTLPFAFLTTFFIAEQSCHPALNYQL